MADRVKNPSLYRSLRHLRAGGLHKALGVPLDKKIPKEAVEKATHSKNSHVAHMANMAQTMSHFKH